MGVLGFVSDRKNYSANSLQETEIQMKTMQRLIAGLRLRETKSCFFLLFCFHTAIG